MEMFCIPDTPGSPDPATEGKPGCSESSLDLADSVLLLGLTAGLLSLRSHSKSTQELNGCSFICLLRMT